MTVRASALACVLFTFPRHSLVASSPRPSEPRRSFQQCYDTPRFQIAKKKIESSCLMTAAKHQAVATVQTVMQQSPIWHGDIVSTSYMIYTFKRTYIGISLKHIISIIRMLQGQHTGVRKLHQARAPVTLDLSLVLSVCFLRRVRVIKRRQTGSGLLELMHKHDMRLAVVVPCYILRPLLLVGTGSVCLMVRMRAVHGFYLQLGLTTCIPERQRTLKAELSPVLLTLYQPYQNLWKGTRQHWHHFLFTLVLYSMVGGARGPLLFA
eukprot:SAG11_NODE_3684_length_2285_cov_1.829826_3_plen_265_part_00